MASNRACGFDFGTSNSSIGCIVGGEPHLVELQEGRVSIPTAVFLTPDGGAQFGRAAMSSYLDRDEGRLMRSLKSVLGSSLIDETTQFGSRRLKFADVITAFIGFVRKTAGDPTSIVLGRPVHFVDDDQAADARAQEQLHASALAAGFSHVEFQFEPIAAALDYERSVDRESLAFVADIGGGTSDFSIVRVSPERRKRADRRADILACTGVHIGGTDFDRLLDVAAVMPHLGLRSRIRPKGMTTPSWWYQDLATWHRINVLYAPEVASDIRRVKRDAEEPGKLERLLRVIEARKGHALLAAVEEAKIALSEADKTVLDVPMIGKGATLTVKRTLFEKSIAATLDRVGATVAATLVQAGVAAGGISSVFLTGGSSRIPALLAVLREAIPDAEFVEGDAFGSVATGLSLEAEARFGT